VTTVDATFDELVQRHRRELHVHCYRMLGSFTDAEDVVQETFLKAWNKHDTFTGEPGGERAWLYRIATNACIDAIRRNGRQLSTVDSYAEVPWLQPYPDTMLSTVEPGEQVVARETIELTFLAALQLLPGPQRAVLILRDVLDWSAAETAELLEISVAAANSALQRARSTLRDKLPAKRSEWSLAEPSEIERDLLRRFIDAHERGDIEASLAMVRHDIRITMPPHPWLFEGVDAMRSGLEQAFGPGSLGDWRLVPTAANRMPAAASYLRHPGETEYRAFKLDVLRVEGDLVVEVTTFDAALFDRFGLPEVLPEPLP
jgi:RNA polymerase sigma-70 factor (TIGR02960 family)